MDRSFTPILRAALLVVGLLFGQASLSDPPGGRLPPDERERLRQELRQQRNWERQDARQREERQRMSPEERRQLRMLLRERTGEERGQPRK